MIALDWHGLPRVCVKTSRPFFFRVNLQKSAAVLLQPAARQSALRLSPSRGRISAWRPAVAYKPTSCVYMRRYKATAGSAAQDAASASSHMLKNISMDI